MKVFSRVVLGVVVAVMVCGVSGCSAEPIRVVGPPSLIPLPNFVGLDVATAEVLVINLDLVLQASSDSGSVTTQSPAPNTEVPPGTTVTLGTGDAPAP